MTLKVNPKKQRTDKKQIFNAATNNELPCHFWWMCSCHTYPTPQPAGI